MKLEPLENSLRARLPEDAATGQQVCETLALPNLGTLEVRLAVARNGQRRFAYTLAGRRIQREALLHLMCNEPHCPVAQDVHRRWFDVTNPRAGQGAGAAACSRQRSAGLQFRPLRVLPLMEEREFSVQGRTYSARPAVWRCQRPCPVLAHAPLRLEVPGWDIFEGGRWLAGGLQAAPDGGQRPQFEALADIEPWLQARQACKLQAHAN